MLSHRTFNIFVPCAELCPEFPRFHLQLNVPVAFFAYNQEAFSDCAGFPYDFKVIDQVGWIY